MKTTAIKLLCVTLLLSSLFSLYGCCCLPDIGLEEKLPGMTVSSAKSETSADETFIIDEGKTHPLSGYYVDLAMLTEDFDGVLATIRQLPPLTDVMVEVKDERGRFFYTTDLGENHPDIDPAKMDILIRELCDSGLYAIACFPAYKEYLYPMENTACGLFSPNGAHLYLDENRCYWLDPSSDSTTAFLLSQIDEVKSLGFGEAVLTSFCFPDTNEIAFNGDRTQALNIAAKNLRDACISEFFVLSFETTDPDFQLPDSRCRSYKLGFSAEQASRTVEEFESGDPQTQLVFTAELPDPRFDSYSLLLPITSAQTEE